MNSLPRIILIPGWAHDALAMEELRKNLESAANVCPVSCGNLWSSDTAAGAPSSYARNLGRMIEKTGEIAFVAGWSLGGMIALETACCRPELVAGVILIATTPRFCSGQNWTAGAPPGALRVMARKFKRDSREVLEGFFKNVALPSPEREEMLSLKIEKARVMNPLELLSGLNYLSVTDLRNEATKINVPALVLHGKRDCVIPVEAGMALKSLLPISEGRIYDNYGHGLPWQNPIAIAGDIRGFLEECQSRNIKQFH